MRDVDFLCELLESVACDGMKVLELGVEHGSSLFALAPIVKNHKGFILGVDKWANEEMYCKVITESFNDFRNVVELQRVDLFYFDQIIPDNHFDFIHFDACYTWPEVKLMIQRYLPKAKKGALICGHGADFYWGNIPEKERETYTIYPNLITVGLPPGSLPYTLSEMYNGGSPAIHLNLARALYELF